MPSTPYNSIEPLVQKGLPMALKIVYQICCGIDVHKTFVVACIASTNKQGLTAYKHHRFSTFTQGLKKLLQWLLDTKNGLFVIPLWEWIIFIILFQPSFSPFLY